MELTGRDRKRADAYAETLRLLQEGRELRSILFGLYLRYSGMEIEESIRLELPELSETIYGAYRQFLDEGRRTGQNCANRTRLH